MAERFDAVVVGAGPAGSAAALVLARRGCRVALVERGPFPGSKNMYGGVVYGRVLDDLVPRWWEQAPLQRFVTRRSTMVLTETQALSVDFRSRAWGEPPYNGATALRPEFDSWLASLAEAAGAELICSTTATSLIREGRRVVGVQTDRPAGELLADVVVACDGVNSFLAKEAGLFRRPDPAHYTLGAKEVLALPREEIEARFGLSGREGADIEILGCTGEIPGGGFVYTNLDTVACGVVLHLPELARSGRRPEEVLAGLKAHPAVAPLVSGGRLVEYSAHLIPEAGLRMQPRLVADGIVVAGDAAALCLAAGIWLEGVNFAIGSGAAAGEAVAEALARGDPSARGLSSYRQRLEASFVLADHRKLKRAPQLVMSPRVQRRYPAVACNLVEALFTVDNPRPKRGVVSLARRELARAGLRLPELLADAFAIVRTFG